MARRRRYSDAATTSWWPAIKSTAFAVILAGLLLGAGNTTRLLVAIEIADDLIGGAEVAVAEPSVTDRPVETLVDRIGEFEFTASESAETDPAPGQSEPLTVAHLAGDRAPAEAASGAMRDAAIRVVAVRRGDTLMDILLSVGLGRAEAHEAINALSGLYDPRGLKPGQEITFTFAPWDGGPMIGAWLSARVDRDVGLSREPGGRFTAHQRDRSLVAEAARSAGMVQSSLYEAGLSAGVPAQIMVELIRAFSFDVDFQREIQPGDAFEVLFDRYRDETGKVVKEGILRHASLLLSGRRLAIYLFADRDGVAGYYNDRGESVRKALLKTPVDGARLTSGFGSRIHPILGYSAFHKGVDFGAPTGTPVQAAGDGIVEMSGWFGGYGNYVRIRHNGEYSTAYAHLSRYAQGIGDGARVKQGQIIGYVGSTGRSTGPHLHYEVMRRGAQINPMGVKFPTGRKLDGLDLVAFARTRIKIDDLLALEAVTVQAAARPPEPRPAD